MGRGEVLPEGERVSVVGEERVVAIAEEREASDKEGGEAPHRKEVAVALEAQVLCEERVLD